MAVGSFFFSAAPTAQNSPELQFRFINSFIQLSLLRSLLVVERKELLNMKQFFFGITRERNITRSL